MVEFHRCRTPPLTVLNLQETDFEMVNSDIYQDDPLSSKMEKYFLQDSSEEMLPAIANKNLFRVHGVLLKTIFGQSSCLLDKHVRKNIDALSTQYR